MRCPRCGNENPGTNRFCGMCGATLLPAPAPVARPPRRCSAPRCDSEPPARSASPIRTTGFCTPLRETSSAESALRERRRTIEIDPASAGPRFWD